MFYYTDQEHAHLSHLAEQTSRTGVMTAACWRHSIDVAVRDNAPSIALDRWVRRLSELADECDTDFSRGEHLDWP